MQIVRIVQRVNLTGQRYIKLEQFICGCQCKRRLIYLITIQHQCEIVDARQQNSVVFAILIGLEERFSTPDLHCYIRCDLIIVETNNTSHARGGKFNVLDKRNLVL